MRFNIRMVLGNYKNGKEKNKIEEEEMYKYLMEGQDIIMRCVADA